MAESKATIIQSSIFKGKTEGVPARLDGRRIRFIEVPARMAGTTFTMLGTFDGFKWFQIMTPAGRPVQFSIAAANETVDKRDTQFDRSIQVLAVADPAIFEGIPFIAPQADTPQFEDQVFRFYCI